MFNKTNKKRYVNRRNFIHTALAASTIAINPISSHAWNYESTNSTFLPTATDSLTLYSEIIDNIADSILEAYYRIVRMFIVDTKAHFKELSDLVVQLEKECPELRSNDQISLIKKANAQILQINYDPRENITLISSHLSLVKYTIDQVISNNEFDSQNEQNTSITLSPRAVKVLQQILKLIHNFNKPIEGLEQADEIYRKAQNGTKEIIKNTKKEINIAIQKLIAIYLSKDSNQSKSSIYREEAIKNILQAIEYLRELDTYKSKHPVPKEYENIVNTNIPDEPSKNIRELLIGTKAWIEQDSKIRISMTLQETNGVQIRPVSLTYNPVNFASGLWFEVREILAQDLPTATGIRVFACIALIAPILAGYTEEKFTQFRQEKIYDILQHLIPKSDELSKSDPYKAAKRLANLKL